LTASLSALQCDAPEIDKGARCPVEQALAVKARDRLLELLRAAREITLERHGQDRYQRTLAVVRADGRDVGPVLIAEGLARPYDGKGKRRGRCK
jgi:endonuclease YncB( thermonuclease family)